MAVHLRWETRHTFWLIIAVLIGGALLWNRMTGPAQKPQSLGGGNAARNTPDGDEVIDMGGDWSGYPSLTTFEGPYRVDFWAHSDDGHLLVTLIVGAPKTGDNSSDRMAFQVAGVRTEAGEREIAASTLITFLMKYPMVHVLREPGPGPVQAWICGANPRAKEPGQAPYFLVNEQLMSTGTARFDESLPGTSLFGPVMHELERMAQRKQLGIWADWKEAPATAGNENAPR